MDAWPHMNRLERDIARAGVVVVTVSAIVGGALGWVARQIVEQFHDEGLSDHFKGGT